MIGKKSEAMVVSVLLLASISAVLVDGSAFAAQDEPRTLEVGSGKDFENIQVAIDNASPGDTVLVYPGTYEEGLMITTDNITLRSVEAPEATVILGEMVMVGIEIGAENVVIDGFRIENCKIGILSHCNNSTIRNNVVTNNHDGISMRGDNSTIRNNVVNSNNHNGISLIESSNSTIRNNVVNSNNTDGIFLMGSSNSTIRNNVVNSNNHDGISLIESSNNTIENNVVNSNNHDAIHFREAPNNTIENNVLHFNSRPIDVRRHSDNTTIRNNVVTLNVYAFIHLYYSNNSTIENNVVMNDGSPYPGIYLYGSDNTTIENNVVANSPGILIRHSSDKNTIRNNVIYSAGYGINLTPDSANNTIENNYIENNSVGVFVGSGNNLIHYNNIVGNGAGVVNKAEGTVDVTLNWWGNIHGPSEVATNVRYSPWLAAPVGTEPMILGCGMGVAVEKENVEVGELVEVTLSVGVEAENIKLVPSIVASPYYRASLERSSPAEWTFEVRPTGEAAGKDIKVRFELYAEYWWHAFGPVPMVRRSVILHVS